MLRDIDSFVSGHQRLPGDHPLAQRALDAQRRLRGERPEGPVPRPGRRRRGPRSEFLDGLQQQLGKGRGFQAFDDLRQFKNPRSVTSVNGNFPYGHIPRKHPGSVVLDNHSFTPTPAVPASSPQAASPPEPVRPATS